MKDIKTILSAIVAILIYFTLEMLGRIIGGTIGHIIIRNLWFIPVILVISYLWKRTKTLEKLTIMSIIGYVLYVLYYTIKKLIY